MYVDHAIDEFLGLFANKTLEYIRTPDEQTYCPPYNLIKIFVLLPLSPFMKRSAYRLLNKIVMIIVFFPSLCLIAWYESRFGSLDLVVFLIFRIQARWLVHCHLIGISDDEVSSGWDIENEFDPEGSGWAERVKSTIPHIEEDEMYMLRHIDKAVKAISQKVGVPAPS
jgi:hypothetical protein